jgi:hypothetical protein
MIELPNKLDRRFRRDQRVRLIKPAGVPELPAGTEMILVKYEDQWRVSRELVYCKRSPETADYITSAFFEDELEAVT